MSLREDINFSLWCDFIERDFLENKFKTMIENKTIYGATSNPAIFASSISNSIAYRQQLDMLQANDAKKIYEELAITDIKRAATLLDELHHENEDDGFISIEVDPLLCDDTQATIKEALRLHQFIAAENVMIKIPATNAGYEAMSKLTSMGININATLVFSPKQAIKCAEALDEGIKLSNKDIKAVISIFVSRFDRHCDEEFRNKGLEVSKLGIINATKCYYEINKFKNSNIRTLFASTGVKGDLLKASYYIDNLLFPNSVNTAPLSTIDNWIEEGAKTKSSILSEEECNLFFDKLTSNKIDMNDVYEILLDEGLEAFKVSFKDLLNKLKT